MPARMGRRREVQPEEGQQQRSGWWPTVSEELGSFSRKNALSVGCCCLELAFIAFVVLALLLLWLMGAP